MDNIRKDTVSIFSILQLESVQLLNQQQEKTTQLQKKVRLKTLYGDIILKIWNKAGKGREGSTLPICLYL